MYFAGLDVHAQYIQAVVLDKDGAVAAEGRVNTRDPAEISVFLASFRPLHAVVETCPFWPWIRDELEGSGVVFHLAHARELRAIAHHAQKNDQVDAHLLARMLMAKLIPPAHAHTTEHLEELRLVRHYAWLTRYRTMFANRIHGQLHQSGIQLQREQLLGQKGREALRRFAPRLSPEQRRVIRSHLAMIKSVNGMLSMLRRQIRQKASTSASATLLQSVPGIGPYWGLLLAAELAPIERFRKADNLVSYAGLAPITRATGGHVNHGPLPKSANRWVRGALVAAVMSHVRHAPNSRLSRHYEQTKARIGWKKARVSTARKLARVLHSMLHSGRAWKNDHPDGRDSKSHMQEVAALSLIESGQLA